MVRIEVQNLTALLTPIFAKSQLSRNQEGTQSRGTPSVIPGRQIQGGGRREEALPKGQP